jgi:hypothetical protein
MVKALAFVVALLVLSVHPVSAQQQPVGGTRTSLADAAAEAAKIPHEWALSPNAVPVYDPVAAAAATSALQTSSEAPDATHELLKAVKQVVLFWKARSRTLQTQTDNDRTSARAAEALVIARQRNLTAARSELAIVMATRALAAAEADWSRLRAAVANDVRTMGDLEREAHRAGVPPGWLVLE